VEPNQHLRVVEQKNIFYKLILYKKYNKRFGSTFSKGGKGGKRWIKTT
jgi:hypothetical protein